MPVATDLHEPATEAPRAAAAAPRALPGSSHLAALLESNVFVICVIAACCVLRARLGRVTVGADGWYTVLGGRIVAHSGLPHHDTLTIFTLGHTWVDQQWLAQLVFYGLWAAGGWALATLVVTALSVAAFAIGAATARRLGASDRDTAVVLAFAFFVGVSNTSLRAQIFAYPLFALVFALLMLDARRASRRVWLVLPLLMLWANIHGSVVVGAALVALRGATAVWPALRDRRLDLRLLRRAAALVLLPWVCILVSPYGLALPHYYRTVLGSSGISHNVTEWQPSTVTLVPVFFVLLLGGMWLVGRARGALTGFEQLALLGTAVLGLDALRNGVWFALVAAAVLPLALEKTWPASGAARHRRVNLALASAGVAVTVLFSLVLLLHGRSWYERSFPTPAATVVAQAARANPRLRIYSNEAYADWLIFEHPELAGRVAYDVRFELLKASQLNALARFRTQTGVGWQDIAAGYGLLVLDPNSTDSGAIKYYEAKPGARVLYRDEHVVVLQR